jgi:glutaredoxin 3
MACRCSGVDERVNVAAHPVVMYTTSWCGFCARARRLFEGKGVAFTDIDVEATEGARAEMQHRSGRTSVPQIFVGEQHLGGYDDVKALDDRGELDPLLGTQRN